MKYRNWVLFVYVKGLSLQSCARKMAIPLSFFFPKACVLLSTCHSNDFCMNDKNNSFQFDKSSIIIQNEDYKIWKNWKFYE